MNLDKLKSIGSEWAKGGHHRIYVNNLCELYGLELNFYGTGNISSATLHGEKISNGSARGIAADLRSAKVYYDVTSGEWVTSGLNEKRKAAILEALDEILADEPESVEEVETKATTYLFTDLFDYSEPAYEPITAEQRAYYDSIGWTIYEGNQTGAGR